MTQRYSIADLRYAGGKAHETRYVSEDDYDLLARKCDAALAELNMVRKAVPNSTLELVSLQQRLAAADERVDVLEGLLRKLWHVVPNGYKSEIGAALPPAEVRGNIPACDYQIDMDQN